MPRTYIIQNQDRLITDPFYFDINRDFSDDTDDFNLPNANAINNQIQNILTTVRGSREEEPTFGSNIEEYLFEPADDITAWRIETEIFDSIITWLGDRIQLNLGDTAVIPKDGTRYLVRIAYVIRITQTEGAANLVFATVGTGSR